MSASKCQVTERTAHMKSLWEATITYMRQRQFGQGCLQRNRKEIVIKILKEDGQDMLTAWIWGNGSVWGIFKKMIPSY
jgi:hypothetical protein